MALHVRVITNLEQSIPHAARQQIHPPARSWTQIVATRWTMSSKTSSFYPRSLLCVLTLSLHKSRLLIHPQRVRLYGADCNQSALVLEAVQQTKVNLTVWLGNYVSATDGGEAYERQRDTIKEVIQTYGTDHIR